MFTGPAVSCAVDNTNRADTCTIQGAGSGKGTLQNAYDAGVANTGGNITLGTPGPVTIKDSTATSTLLSVTDTSTVSLTSNVANGAAAIGVKLDTVNALTAANGTCNVQIDNNGTRIGCLSRQSDLTNGLRISDGPSGTANSFIVTNESTGTQLAYGTSFVGVQTAITGVTFRVSGTDQWHIDAAKLYPQTTLSEDIGDATHVVTNGYINFVDAGTGNALNLGVNSTTGVNIGNATAKVNINYATTATGGATTATLGTLGAAGPTTAAQNSWLPITIGGTTGYFIPVWR